MTNGEAKKLIRTILGAAAGQIDSSVVVSELAAQGSLPDDFRARFNSLNKRGYIRMGINDVLVTASGAKFVA